jgi:hypothetical protein
MPKVFLSFEAENAQELRDLVARYLSSQRSFAWAADVEKPSPPDLLEDQETLSDEEYDEKHRNDVPPPLPEPTPAPKTRKPRAARVSAPAAAPEPAALQAPAPLARELPALETLKSVITTAVRLAQKGEGSKKILELLPGFKDASGLDFIMNAEDKHREPLYDLVLAADLPVV